MRKIIVLVITFLFLLTSTAFAEENTVNVKWFGQACFQLTMPDGKVIVIDPYSEKVGYDIPELSADILLVTHEHHDHSNVDIVSGDPKILRGLTEGGKDYNKVSYDEGGLKIYSVNSYHDKEKGAKRGKNAIFVIEAGGKKIVHLGDLGHTLTDEQIKEIGEVSLLLIPVGGYYTIDAEEANEVTNQLNPKFVIPMHFKTPMTPDLPIAPSYGYVRGKKIFYGKGNEIEIDLTKKSRYKYYLLKWK
jgi:L-ascorbate metabolism protein UlaG (beta-lactamase superfamily)